MKILHTSDIHIREYQDDRWNTLKELIEIGKKEKIDVFIIAGDLFDKSYIGDMLRDKIREIFTNTGFKIVLMPGNHDCKSYETGLFFGNDVVLLTHQSNVWEQDTIRICGFPFESIERDEILNKINSLAEKLTSDKTNILIFHGELLDGPFSRNDFGDEEVKRYMPMKLSDLENLSINYVLAGHFHTKFQIRQFANNSFFVYSGSPISLTRKEIGRRNVNIFEVGKPPNQFPLDTPHYENIVIDFDSNHPESPNQMIERIYNALHPNAKIFLTIKGYINSDAIGMTEQQLKESIEKKFANKCLEPPNFHCLDVKTILQDDLFNRFLIKLNGLNAIDFTEERKKELRNLAIQAMMRLNS